MRQGRDRNMAADHRNRLIRWTVRRAMWDRGRMAPCTNARTV
jgi:hypothetical protein